MTVEAALAEWLAIGERMAELDAQGFRAIVTTMMARIGMREAEPAPAVRALTLLRVLNGGGGR